MNLDRRRFLLLSASGFLGSLTAAACEAGSDESVDRPLLVAMLGPERVRSIGQRYLAATPNENNPAALRSAIAESRKQSRIPLMPRPLGDQVREDFVAGHTVLVDGWVLSVTEARQAALFALSA